MAIYPHGYPNRRKELYRTFFAAVVIKYPPVLFPPHGPLCMHLDVKPIMVPVPVSAIAIFLIAIPGIYMPTIDIDSKCRSHGGGAAHGMKEYGTQFTRNAHRHRSPIFPLKIRRTE